VIVVSDTSPISNLILVNYIHLLPQLFGTIIIPEAVHQELLANGSNHPVTQTIQAVDWLEVRSVTNQQQVEALERDHNLDLGEANAIVLALELQAAQLLIDERLGRLEAKRRGLRITGILGILLAAKHKALLSEVRPVMDALIQQANFRISPQLYSEVLQLAGEQLQP
jgi:predicted nucleic acid-binding protein